MHMISYTTSCPMITNGRKGVRWARGCLEAPACCGRSLSVAVHICEFMKRQFDTLTPMSSTSKEGTATPRPSQARGEGLESLLSNLQSQFEHHASKSFQQDVTTQARQLIQDVDRHKTDHSTRVGDIKERIRVEHPKEIRTRLSPEIQNQIKSEVQAATKDKIAQHYKELIPIPLQKQHHETKEQLDLARAAFINSDSRRSNSSIDILLDAYKLDRLKPVLKSDGKPSELWPADLNSLLAYDRKNLSPNFQAFTPTHTISPLPLGQKKLNR
ncbi:hypothetical protein D9757_006131 [Collybiopsis confluens]|uniref:Uncharacterized protein n=1 Tax=Collybiopsis confluens TaxID=2823264 RepID=A0A8H5HHQ4_9AGAR|nr:hypothetical protein D9757_006131 [Collybiopsis confluens]